MDPPDKGVSPPTLIELKDGLLTVTLKSTVSGTDPFVSMGFGRLAVSLTVCANLSTTYLERDDFY